MLCFRSTKRLLNKNAQFNSTIAIDIGPSTSIVCVLEDGAPKVIENIEGERTTPAYVAFEDDISVVGVTARRQALIHPKNTIYGFHGLMGKKYDDEFVKKSKLNYKIVPRDGKIAIEDGAKKIRSVEEVTSMLLKRMRETAENNLGKQVASAVVGIPTYFKEEETKSLLEAIGLIGLKVENFVLEPVAAALAYGFGKQPGSKKVLVFDLGGRGLDITLLDILGGSIDVKLTARDEFLGGDFFDDALIAYVQKEFQDKEGIDLTGQALAQQKLKNSVEVAKCELSTSMSNEINIPYIAADEKGPKHLLVKISRSKLESIIEPLILRTLEPVKSLLAEAKLNPGDIDDILLVGGQAKTPRVAENLETFFGKPVFKSNSLSPDEVVAMGLHLFSGVKTGTGEITKFTIVPLDIGVDVFGKKEILASKGTKLPVEVKRIFTTANDNQTEVDIKILIGASQISAKNETILRVALSSLPNSLQHELKIEVILKINADGDLTVNAREILTQSVAVTSTIKSFGGLSQDRVNAIIEESSKTDELPDLKALDEKKLFFAEFTEMERIVFSCRSILSESDRSKFSKQLGTFKMELENGTLQDPKSKLKEFNILMANALCNSIKEEQKKTIKY